MIELLVERLRQARSVAVLTGAGVSAESGIPGLHTDHPECGRPASPRRQPKRARITQNKSEPVASGLSDREEEASRAAMFGFHPS
jgi:hypothetical protein